MMIPQTLHGYERGHRLLASGGDISPEEHDLLERLSDLSGYLPIGTTFERYFTGFACGRYYALACTWPDPEATRGGAVLTHTLLIPREQAGAVGNLGAAMARLRRPPSTRSKGDYAAPATWESPPPLAAPTPRHAKDALTLLFGESARPIVWIDDRPPDDIIIWCWSLLWPEARLDFSFCTFTLAPRQVAGRVFTLLGVPPAASGAFSNLGAHPAWWELGRMRASGSANANFLEALQAQPQHEIHRLLKMARDADFRPAPPELAVLFRLDELRQGARERLTAARSYADLLAARMPSLPPEHPWWVEALGLLLDRQADAPLEPRPLWDLIDLLKRPQALALARDPARSARIADTVRQELGRRLAVNPTLAAEGLRELFGVVARGWSLWSALRAAVDDAVAAAPDQEHATRIARIILSSLPPENASGAELIAAALRPLPSGERASCVQDLLPTLDAVAVQKLGEVALQLDDLRLLLVVVSARQGEAKAMQVCAQLAAERDRIQDLPALFEHLPSVSVLQWALDNDDVRLGRLSMNLGGRAARDQQVKAETLCSWWPSRPGAGMVLAGLGRARWELVSALRGQDAMARDLILSALATTDSSLELAADAALEAIDSKALVAPGVLEALHAHSSPSFARRVVAAVAPAVAKAMCACTMGAEEGARWMSIPVIREQLGRVDRWRLTPVEVGALPELVAAVVGAEGWQNLTWAQTLLAEAIHAANTDAVERATPALLQLLDRCRLVEDRFFLAAELLVAVKRTRSPSGYLLVERTFREVYPTVFEGSRPSWNPLTWFSERGWDRAKALRHWLVDAWIENRWPPPDLIRTIDGMRGEGMLYIKVGKRAWKTPEGRALLAAARDNLPPELPSKWGGVLTQTLTQGPPAADDD